LTTSQRQSAPTTGTGERSFQQSLAARALAVSSIGGVGSTFAWLATRGRLDIAVVVLMPLVAATTLYALTRTTRATPEAQSTARSVNAER
jgi:hypothetical protein